MQNLCLPRLADPQHTHAHTHTHTHTHTHNQPPTHTHTQPTPNTHTHTQALPEAVHPPTCLNSRGGWPCQSGRRGTPGVPAPTAHLEKWPRHLGAGPEKRQKTTEGRRGHLPNKGGRASNQVEEGACQAQEAPKARLTPSPSPALTVAGGRWGRTLRAGPVPEEPPRRLRPAGGPHPIGAASSRPGTLHGIRTPTH